MVPSKIEKNKVAEIEYTLALDDGEVVDTTDGRPLPYLHGSGTLIPGLESALEGHEVGDKLSLTIEPANAYGDYDEELTESLPRSDVPEGVELSEGDEVVLEADDGGELVGYVAEIDDDSVVLDLNHPLAGETLHFEVSVVSIREATPEEIEAQFVEDPHDLDDDDDDDGSPHDCGHCSGHH